MAGVGTRRPGLAGVRGRARRPGVQGGDHRWCMAGKEVGCGPLSLIPTVISPAAGSSCASRTGARVCLATVDFLSDPGSWREPGTFLQPGAPSGL